MVHEGRHNQPHSYSETSMRPHICKCQAIWGSEQGLHEGLLNVLVKCDLVEDTTVVGGDADAAAVTASLHDTRTVRGGECPSPHHAAWEPVARGSQGQDPADSAHKWQNWDSC